MRWEHDRQISMSPESFDEVRPNLLQLSVETVEMARAVLVDGLSRKEVAEKFDADPARVRWALHRVRRALNGVPPGWEHIEVYLPAAKAREVQALAADALAKYQWPGRRAGRRSKS